MTAIEWFNDIDQGADVDEIVAFEDERGVLSDLTDCDFRGTLKIDSQVSSPVLAEFACLVIDAEGPATTKNPVLTNRAVSITLDGMELDDLAPGVYRFELWITDSLNRTYCYLAGPWKLHARGSR